MAWSPRAARPCADTRLVGFASDRRGRAGQGGSRAEPRHLTVIRVVGGPIARDSRIPGLAAAREGVAVPRARTSTAATTGGTGTCPPRCLTTLGGGTRTG